MLSKFDHDNIIRSRPIVSLVNHTLTFLSTDRTLNIEQTPCSTRTGAAVPCVDLRLCLQYSGVGVGQQAGQWASR